MEEDLDKIAQGDIERNSVLLEFYDKFKKDLVKFGGQEASRKAIETDVECPECKKKLVIRFSKNGEFAGCSGFPECKFTSNFTKAEDGTITLVHEEAQVVDISCPQCSKTLVKKMGRFGPFLSCPGYPDCKYIHQESLKTPCDVCGEKMVKRRWRGGAFWGCSGYPKCKNSIFGSIAEEKCPSCNAPYLVTNKDKATKELVTTCIKKCGYSVKKEEE